MLKELIKGSAIAAASMLLTAGGAFAVPVLQIFIEDAVYERAVDNPDDPDTWAKVGIGSFRLWVLGDTSQGAINNVQFVASFADGLTPSLSFSPSTVDIALGFGDTTFPVPVTGPGAPFDAEDLGGTLPPHSVLVAGRTAVEFGLGNFSETGTFLTDVEPVGATFPGGFPPVGTQLGQINVYDVLVSGLAVGEQVHFDVYGTQVRDHGPTRIVSAPGSHDARWEQAIITQVPEPRSMLLLMGGLLGVAALRRRTQDRSALSTAA